MLGHDPAEQREAQVGAHGLRDRDPVVAGRALHRLEALVHDHGDGVAVGRGDGGAGGVMRVPGPVGAAGQAHGIDAQEVAGRLDGVGVVRRVGGAGVGGGGGGAVLQQHERAQGAPLRRRGCGLAHVVPGLRAVLHRAAHVAELRAGEHVGALGHAGDARLVDQGGGQVAAAQRLERVQPVDVTAVGEGFAVAGAFGEAVAEAPGQAVRGRARLPGQRHQGPVGRQDEGGGDGGQAEAGADIRVDQVAVLDRGESARHREPAEVHVGRGAAVGTGVVAQHPQVVRHHARGLGRAEARSLGLGVGDPGGAGLIGADVAGVLVEVDDGVGVVLDGGGRGLHRLLQVGHDHVDPGSQGLGLAGAQVGGEAVDVRVAERLRQQAGRGQDAGRRHRRVGEVAEGLEVVGADLRVLGAGGADLGDQAGADGVQHGLVFRHGVDDGVRRVRPAERDLPHGRGAREVGRRVGPGEAFERIGPEVDGAVAVREELGHGARGSAARRRP